jgi:hypothetical protein
MVRLLRLLSFAASQQYQKGGESDDADASMNCDPHGEQMMIEESSQSRVLLSG